MSKNADNRRLRASRREIVSNDQFAAFVGRILRAYARRIATGDIEALTDMIRTAHQIESDLENVIRDAAFSLHESGYSWTEIAARLGVSRQAVRKRWGGAQS